MKSDQARDSLTAPTEQQRPSLALRFFLVVAALFVSSLPYLYGTLHAVPESVYTGMRPLNASDYNVNLSFIEQYREGRVIVKNLYAPEPHKPFLIRPIYFLLFAPFQLFDGLSNPVVFHIVRIIAGAALLLCLFRWIPAYLPEPRMTLLTFLLLAFSSGFGFFVQKWIAHPLDFTVPESNLFLTLGEPPHFLSSLFLLLFGLTSLYLAIVRNPRAIVWFCISLLLLWFEHPYEAVVLAAVGFCNLWLLPTNRLRIAALAGLVVVTLPAIFYYNQLRQNPVFASWSQQNVLMTPSLLLLVLGFLPLIVFAIPGLASARKDRRYQMAVKFLLIWIFVQTILCYVPVPFQRRFIAGLQFPLAILAGIGLASLRSSGLTAAVLFFSAITNLSITWQQIAELRKGEMPFYLPDSYLPAFDWLKNQPKDSIALSGYITGNFIPAYTGLITYAGHSIQTPNVVEKKQAIANYYRSPNADFVSRNNIRFVFYGREERVLSQGGTPRSPLSLAYQKDDLQIYTLTPTGGQK